MVNQFNPLTDHSNNWKTVHLTYIYKPFKSLENQSNPLIGYPNQWKINSTHLQTIQIIWKLVQHIYRPSKSCVNQSNSLTNYPNHWQTIPNSLIGYLNQWKVMSFHSNAIQIIGKLIQHAHKPSKLLENYFNSFIGCPNQWKVISSHSQTI